MAKIAERLLELGQFPDSCDSSTSNRQSQWDFCSASHNENGGWTTTYTCQNDFNATLHSAVFSIQYLSVIADAVAERYQTRLEFLRLESVVVRFVKMTERLTELFHLLGADSLRVSRQHLNVHSRWENYRLQCSSKYNTWISITRNPAITWDGIRLLCYLR